MCTTRMMTGVGRPQFSAVLECAAEARAARQAHLGRRRRALPARRRPGPRRRRGERDVRLVARRHLRDRRRHACATPTAGSTRRASAWRRTGRCKNRTRDESAFERARKELFEEGISTSRMYLDPDRPGVEDIIDQIVAGRAQRLHVRRRRAPSPSSTSEPSSACRARPATTRVSRSPPTGDASRGAVAIAPRCRWRTP